jgi:hypothetical protein
MRITFAMVDLFSGSVFGRLLLPHTPEAMQLTSIAKQAKPGGEE